MLTNYYYTIDSDGLFPHKKVDIPAFTKEIRDSGIATALHEVAIVGGNCVVTFKEVLSMSDHVILDTLVQAHQAVPLITERQIVKLQAFTQTGRERQVWGQRVVGTLNGVTNIDFQWANDIEIQGFQIEVANHTEGDYMEAFVVMPTVQGEIVVHQFGKTVYVKPSKRYDYGAEETKVVPAGIILRLTYHSITNSGPQPIVYVDAITWV
jgi:hypothetical protein